jgi:hypothetical protein
MYYSIDNPILFNVWRYAGVMLAAVLVSLAGKAFSWRSLLFGALANVAMVLMIWMAPCCDLYRWVLGFPWISLASVTAAALSGVLGIVLAEAVSSCVKALQGRLRHAFSARNPR